MRVAILILALILGAWLLLQSLLVFAGGALTEDAGVGAAGLGGLIMALLWLIAGAFAIGVPVVSIIAFVIASFLAFALSGDFRDLVFWGGASLVLAALSLISIFTRRRGTRVDERTQRERDARLAAGIRESMATERLQPIAVNFARGVGRRGRAAVRLHYPPADEPWPQVRLYRLRQLGPTKAVVTR